MKNYLQLLHMFFLIIFVGGCGAEVEEDRSELYVSAAISLSEVLEEVKELFEVEHDVTITYQFGGSGKLAQQMEQGAPGDVFISANEDWMNRLLEKELIDEASLTPVIGNKLVLVKEKNETKSITSLTDLTSPSIRQIAIGHPESVPAGQYAQMALQNSNMWTDIEEKTILSQDVRQVLTYVETGNAELGFVYESDAFEADTIEVLTYIEQSLYNPIIYPGGVRTDSENKTLAKTFLQFLRSEEVQNAFMQHGFSESDGGDINGGN